MSSIAEESAPLLKKIVPSTEKDQNEQSVATHERDLNQVVVYRRRWYVLGLFSFQCIFQVMVWSTWGPLAGSVEVAFGWNQSNIALLTSWAHIMYISTTFLGAWLIDKKGLRWSGCICSMCLAVGALIRCITTEPPYVTWTMNIGQAVNGLSTPLVYGTTPMLSAVWFPASQRATATGISTGLTMFGMALSFLLGPLVVPDVKISNSTLNAVNQSNTTDVVSIRQGISKLMYIEAGLAVFILLLTLLYYPARPPSPPSVSAGVERVHFKQGLRTLLRSRRFWHLALVLGVSNGVYSSWLSVADLNLKNLGVSQATAGSIGFLSVVVSALFAMSIGLFGDRFHKRMKIYLVVLFTSGAILFLLYCLVSIAAIPYHLAWFYTTSILGSVALNGGLPLFYELTCEAAYPVSEAIANSVLAWLVSASSLVFFLVLFASTETMWMNWANFACATISIPALLTYKPGRHRRLETDTTSLCR